MAEEEAGNRDCIEAMALLVALDSENTDKWLDLLLTFNLIAYRQPDLGVFSYPPVRHVTVASIVDDMMGNEHVRRDFRFTLDRLPLIMHELKLGPTLAFHSTPHTRYSYQIEEGVLMWLYWRSRAGRTMHDVSMLFGGGIARSSEVIRAIACSIYNRWSHRIVRSDFSHWDNRVPEWVEAFNFYMGGPQNVPAHVGACIGFLDGQLAPTCRPGDDGIQNAVYCGHHKDHGLAWQHVVGLDGLTARQYFCRCSNQGRCSCCEMRCILILAACNSFV